MLLPLLLQRIRCIRNEIIDNSDRQPARAAATTTNTRTKNLNENEVTLYIQRIYLGNRI